MIKPKVEKKRQATTMPAAEREKLWERTGGLCDWCGKPMHKDDMDAHHRKLRSAGGTWDLSNIAGVHHDCHVNQPGSIHLEPKRAMSTGFIRSRFEEPASSGLPTPIIEMHDGIWRLNDDGTRTSVELPF